MRSDAPPPLLLIHVKSVRENMSFSAGNHCGRAARQGRFQTVGSTFVWRSDMTTVIREAGNANEVRSFLWMYEMMEKARYYEDTMAAANREGRPRNSTSVQVPFREKCTWRQDMEPCAAGVWSIWQDDAVTATTRPFYGRCKGVDLKRIRPKSTARRAVSLAGAAAYASAGPGGELSPAAASSHRALARRRRSACRQDDGKDALPSPISVGRGQSGLFTRP